MDKKTEPPHEILLAQLILSIVIVGLVGHATYEKHETVPKYILRFESGKPIFRFGGTKQIPVNQFRMAHSVLFLLTVSSAYFFVNLLLYVTNKIMKEPLLNATILILMQDVVFCFLMFVCSVVAVAHTGDRATGYREIEILIASTVFAVLAVVASLASATNNVQRVYIKHRSPSTPPSPVYSTPTSYRYDVRLNPVKYGYAPVAPSSAYLVPPEYLIPQSVAHYVPAPQPLPTYVSAPQPSPAFVPASQPSPAYAPAPPTPSHTAYVPASPAPAPTTYLPYDVLAHILQARAHQFIGRHYPHAHYH